jgi:hypothetical protein
LIVNTYTKKDWKEAKLKMGFKTKVTSFSAHLHKGNFDGRVQCMATHPVLPWVATVSEKLLPSQSPTSNSTTLVVSVWDHHEGETLLEWSIPKDIWGALWQYEYDNSVNQSGAGIRKRMLQPLAKEEGESPASFRNRLEATRNPSLLTSPKIYAAASAAADKRFGVTPSSFSQASGGGVRHVQFLDRHTLHWEGCHPVASGVFKAAGSSLTTHQCREPHLIVLLEQRIVILRMRSYGGQDKVSVYATIGPEDMTPPPSTTAAVSANKQQRKAYPTSIQPMSGDLFLIGGSDGSIQFYSVREQKMIRSIQAHQSTNSSGSDDHRTGEAVIGIRPALSLAQIYESEQLLSNDTSSQQSTFLQEGSSNSTSASSQAHTSFYRVLTIGANGVAYLWNLSCVTTLSNAPSKARLAANPLLRTSLASTTTVSTTIKIKRPMAKLENINLAISGSNSNDLALSKAASDLLHYDMERDLFVAPLGTAGVSSRSNNHNSLGLWDLSAIPSGIDTPSSSSNHNKGGSQHSSFAASSSHSSHDSGSSGADKQQHWYKRHSTIPGIDPFLQVFLPSNLFDLSVGGTLSTSLSSGTGGPSASSSSSSSLNYAHLVLSPTKHEAFTNESVLPMWILSKATGDAAFISVSLLYTGDPKKKIRPDVHHCTSFASMEIAPPSPQRRNVDSNSGNTVSSTPSPQKIRILTARVPKSYGHSLLVGSNVGCILTKTVQDPKVTSYLC